MKLNGLMVKEAKGQPSLDCTFRSHSLRETDTQLRGGRCRKDQSASMEEPTCSAAEQETWAKREF